jgi:DinB family protein
MRGDAMNEAVFYDHIVAVMAQPPDQRHQELARLHAEALHTYQTVLDRLTAEDVHHPLPNHPDGWTIAQIVGHIAAWDRFAVLAAGDMLAGIQHPRMITDLSGYRESDGTSPAFTTIDDFNAYHADKYESWSWEQLHRFAGDIAATLYALFAHPQLLSAKRLEQTTSFRKRLQNGTIIHNITMGWSLWLTMIEHLAVEHADLLDCYSAA